MFSMQAFSSLAGQTQEASFEGETQELSLEGQAQEASNLITGEPTYWNGPPGGSYIRLSREVEAPTGSSMQNRISVSQVVNYAAIAAYSVVETLKMTYGIDARLKWPNDVVVNGKKITGINAKMTIVSNVIKNTVVNIWTNVNIRLSQLPRIDQTATSLMLERPDCHFDVEKVNREIASSFNKNVGLAESSGLSSLPVSEKLYGFQENVCILSHDSSEGINSDCFALTWAFIKGLGSFGELNVSEGGVDKQIPDGRIISSNNINKYFPALSLMGTIVSSHFLKQVSMKKSGEGKEASSKEGSDTKEKGEKKEKSDKKLKDLSKRLLNWIGGDPSFKVKKKHKDRNSGERDFIVTSKDNQRRFRMDFHDPHNQAEHFHLEINKGAERWEDASDVHQIKFK